MTSSHADPAEVEPDLGSDEDDELAALLDRRLDALLRGEARTVTRAEMKDRLARRRASQPSR